MRRVTRIVRDMTPGPVVMRDGEALPVVAEYETETVWVADPGDEREEWTEERLETVTYSDHPEYVQVGGYYHHGLRQWIPGSRYKPRPAERTDRVRDLVRFWVDERDGLMAEKIRTERKPL